MPSTSPYELRLGEDNLVRVEFNPANEVPRPLRRTRLAPPIPSRRFPAYENIAREVPPLNPSGYEPPPLTIPSFDSYDPDPFPAPEEYSWKYVLDGRTIRAYEVYKYLPRIEHAQPEVSVGEWQESDYIDSGPLRKRVVKEDRGYPVQYEEVRELSMRLRRSIIETYRWGTAIRHTLRRMRDEWGEWMPILRKDQIKGEVTNPVLKEYLANV